jgi:CRP/FNR family transcriptional regulator/CRP/FNR family cyclic AMP-dependent transcriptional regulator
MSSLDLLRKTPLFAGLPEEELQTLAGRLGKRTFARGMILFHKDSPGQTLYLIESGLVRIFVLSENGQEMTLNIHGPGECFGELSLLDGKPRSAGALALEQTVTYILHRDDFLGCLREHPLLAQRVLELLADRLRHLTAYAECLAFLDVPGRLAAALLDLAERHGTRLDDHTVEIDLRLTQTELATWIGATREMVNRALMVFRDRGWITIEGQKIRIADIKQLRERTLR